MAGRAIFPQGGSTITQQLVRGAFLQRQTSQENSYQLRNVGVLPRVLSSVIGARNVSMVVRKREEIRLSLWVEQQMRERFGSKRRAKEEIFARYASFVYMGNGQYGFARAADFYSADVSRRSLSTMLTRRRCWPASRSRRATTRRRLTTAAPSFGAAIKPWY
jgi:Transglycosylase